MEIGEILKNLGPYVFLPVIVYFITNYLKTNIPFFKSVTGLRIVHFLPVVLGMLGGLLLPEDTLGDKLLTGGGLGCLNLLIYKFVTVSLAKKGNLEMKLEAKETVRKSKEP